jgi:acetyl esterase/lipase
LLSGTFQRRNRPNAIISFYGYGDILGDWYSLPSPHYNKFPEISETEAAKRIKSDVPTHAASEDRGPIYLRARQIGSWASLVSGFGQSEIREKLAAYCPVLNIDAHYPPTFLLHGDEDTDVPVEQSKDMYRALTDKNIKTQIYIQQKGGHGFDGAWKNTPDEFGRVVEFLKKIFI